MLEPLPISDLEIVGYANRLTEETRPAVVPPIFRRKGDCDQLFLPPFVMQQGYLCNAAPQAAVELEKLDDAREITLIATPLEAKRDHELWVGLDGVVYYEPISDAKAKLRAIAREKTAEAVQSLQAGDFNVARDCCRVALSADDWLVEPLAIRAAIARKERDQGLERLMTKLAQRHSTEEGFGLLVKGYSEKIGAAPPPPVLVLQTQHSMCGMAARRAA